MRANPSTRSRRSRIDPSLKGFKVTCKTISLGEMQRIPEESVSSLKMGDVHLNTQKDSREFSVNPTSIYDNISIGYLGTIEIKENDTPITPDIPLREETPRYFYDGSMDNGEDIIPLMRISKETGLRRENKLTIFFKYNKEEIDISCDMIPPEIDTDDDSEGDVPPFEEPLDDGLFPLPKVDILPIEVIGAVEVIVFSGFWKLHGSKLWKDKAIPTSSIDGFQSSLHKMGNLLSLSLSNYVYLLACP
ncbi:hypothetical protein Tco_0841875 [Tanacetum coccineum]|uniref:Uncharacterized protein n=1 Tax=Tanacetum coccineum TaxID=301880 RepID=A0ABQ5B1I2_9ASTR